MKRSGETYYSLPYAAVCGAYDAAAMVKDFLVAVSAPPCDTAHGEERGVDSAGQTCEFIDKAWVEVHVGTEVFAVALLAVYCLYCETLKPLEKFELAQASLLRGELPCHFLKQDGAGIAEGIDSMTYAEGYTQGYEEGLRHVGEKHTDEQTTPQTEGENTKISTQEEQQKQGEWQRAKAPKDTQPKDGAT